MPPSVWMSSLVLYCAKSRYTGKGFYEYIVKLNYNITSNEQKLLYKFSVFHGMYCSNGGLPSS